MSNYIWKPIETECTTFDDGVACMKPGPWNIMEGTIMMKYDYDLDHALPKDTMSV
jgi:hypothetical protein